MGKRLTVEDRLWRCNYWYRVWYGAIPGLPNDNITMSSVTNIWNKSFDQLGLVSENGCVIGYNDIENYLNEETGLLDPSQKRRMLRAFPEPIPEADWIECYKHFLLYTIKDRMPVNRENIVIQLQETVDFLTQKKNALHFLQDDVTNMRFDFINPYIPETGGMYKRFDGIKHLLESTELLLPPSKNAMPNPFPVSSAQKRKFLEKCPVYMDSYKRQLVTDSADSMIYPL